jgi:parvulin-like peptidyl-prolyl isomerase
VNGDAVREAELSGALTFELSKYGSGTAGDEAKLAKLKRALLDEMIKNVLLYQRAAKEGLVIAEAELAEHLAQIKSRYTERTFRKLLELKGIDYKEWAEDKRREMMIDKLIQQEVISKIGISAADIQKYYRAHKKEFSHGDEVHARQIVVDDAAKAEELRAKAAGGENFAALAAEFSIAPEAKRGGDLGWFARGIMPKAFDEACFPLPTGDVSPVVKTEYGHHIFKVVERRPAKAVPIEDVKDKIIARLQQEKSEEAFNKWFDGVMKDADVKIDEQALANVRPAGMEAK